MGSLRHFSSDIVKNVVDELTKYELIRQGRKRQFLTLSLNHIKTSFQKNENIKTNIFFVHLINFKAFINTTSCGMFHMKAFPSDNILNDISKRNIIDRILRDVKMDLTAYMSKLTTSVIKDKQILTIKAIEILL